MSSNKSSLLYDIFADKDNIGIGIGKTAYEIIVDGLKEKIDILQNRVNVLEADNKHCNETVIAVVDYLEELRNNKR